MVNWRAIADMEYRIAIARERRPKDFLTLAARAVVKVATAILTVPILPLEFVTTAVGGCLIALTFGIFALLISLIWLPVLGLLAATSWLWLKAWFLRPVLFLPGVLLAIISDVFVALMPDESDAKHAKLSLAEEWPLSWYLLRPPPEYYAALSETELERPSPMPAEDVHKPTAEEEVPARLPSEAAERETQLTPRSLDIARTGLEPARSLARGTVITLFGASGAPGNTTIATNLAVALVQETCQSVALVDLDVRFGDVAILMDIPADRSIANLVLPDDKIDREAVQSCLYNHSSGVAILPAPIRPAEWQTIQPCHVEKTVAVLAATYDYVVLDTPITFNDIVAHALEMANVVLLIVNPDLASLKDTILALEMLRSRSFPAEKVKVVVNHTNEAHTGARVDIRRILGKDVFWSIPYDRNISEATQLGMPIVAAKPKSETAVSMIGLADALRDLL